MNKNKINKYIIYFLFLFKSNLLMNYDEIYSSLAQYIDSHISNFSNSSYSSINKRQQESYKRDFEKLLYHNYKYEKDVKKLTDKVKQDVFNYLNSLDFHEPPDLYELNKLMGINDGLRTEPIYVSVNKSIGDLRKECYA